MPKTHALGLGDWNQLAADFHSESDRGAALLAAGFIENQLTVYLQDRIVDKSLQSKLFGGMGPLSTFSAKAAFGRAFDFIPKNTFTRLEVIRAVRNHFAHHPLNSNFSTPEVVAAMASMPPINPGEPDLPEWTSRDRYLFACALCAAYLDLEYGSNPYSKESKDQAAKAASQTKSPVPDQ